MAGWADDRAKDARDAARKTWGAAWAYLSPEMRRGAIAIQIVGLVNQQHEQYPETLANIQKVIALAMPEDP